MIQKLMTWEQAARIQELLNTNLFESKDWQQGNLADRVEWLLSSVKSLNEQLDHCLDKLSEKEKSS